MLNAHEEIHLDTRNKKIVEKEFTVSCWGLTVTSKSQNQINLKKFGNPQDFLLSVIIPLLAVGNLDMFIF